MSQIIRILNFSTHNENCGIGKYQELFVDSMNKRDNITSDFFSYSPNIIKNLDQEEYKKVLAEFSEKLINYEILHIQHEFSFFGKSELDDIINIANGQGKNIVVTVHTGPDAHSSIRDSLTKPTGLGPRSLISFARNRRAISIFRARYIDPLNKADLILVHNEATEGSLIKWGVHPAVIRLITMPIPDTSHVKKMTLIKDKLNVSSNDIIFATVGFISANKGIGHAIKALNFLPKNFKLVIIGGLHPQASNDNYYEKISDLITKNGLGSRVYITGFIEDDLELNAIIKEVDICVFPYNKEYYSYVTSASLNNSLANGKPTISYKTKSFTEINNTNEVVKFCKSGNHYELAREILDIDKVLYSELALKYAQKHSSDKEALNLARVYEKLVNF